MHDEDERVSRRTFLRVGAAGAAGVAILGCDPDPMGDAGADAALGDAGSDAGTDAALGDGGTPLPALAIPTLDPGELVGGVRVFEIEAQNGATEFRPGLSTATAGYNGALLGPALALRTGEEVELRVTNRLGQPTTTHWHGMHVPADMDGGPHQVIDDGATWAARFTVLNPASLCWFHPHFMAEVTDPRSTSHQVYTGLAGLLYVSDDESDALGLPSTYGVDDVPLILQDKRFNPDGSLLHFDGEPDLHAVRKGGDFMVNGVIGPALDTHAQLVRLRVLIGSNARIYNLALVDDAGVEREFRQIASDGGLLSAPVTMNRLVLTPGERAEIVVDLGADEGRSLSLVSKNEELNRNRFVPLTMQDEWDAVTVPLMTLQVGAATASPVTSLPASLATITRIAEGDADRTRMFVLGAASGGGHPINGQLMDITRTDAEVPLGDTEIWQIRNASQMAHPFHIHGAPFQVLSRTGLAMDGVPDNEMGWKDTVNVRAGETVRVIRRFEDFADPDGFYMFHCHILEHEDHGMMGQFKVV